MIHSSGTVKTLYRQFVAVHSVPFYVLLLVCLISALIIFTCWYLGWALWQVGLFIVLAWLPLLFSLTGSIYRKYGWLALLFIFVVFQGGHLLEHTAQFIQLHLFGFRGPRASGVFGALNIEWVHLIWNSWVLFLSVLLFVVQSSIRKNMWMWALLMFAIYHEIEHLYILSVYLNTHIEGTPGLLAQGGLLFGGLPIVRPDLHFYYAVFTQTLLVMVYVLEIRKKIPVPSPANQPSSARKGRGLFTS